MKKTVLVLTLSLITVIVFSQTSNTNGLQKVIGGVVVAVSGNTAIKDPIELMKLGYNLSPNVLFISNKTYHNFMYGIGNNSLKIVNAYKPRPDLGIYLSAIKSLSTNNGYIGIGAEKFIKAGDVMFFPFIELGTNIGPASNSKLFTVGFHANVQMPIWKKKI